MKLRSSGKSINLKCHLRSSALVFMVTFFPLSLSAQIKAYAGNTEGDCLTIHLVNPSTDTIYYIQNQHEANSLTCQTFDAAPSPDGKQYSIWISDEKPQIVRYDLMLPRDTLSYKLIISGDHKEKGKQLLICARKSNKVIDTHEEKKRNKQIGRLSGCWQVIPIIENR